MFTKANADAGGRAINARLERYVADHPDRAVLVASLGHEYYLAALKQAAVVIGNTSSGLIEAPAAGAPTVNIGIRQDGRLRSQSVIDCPEERGAIAAAIDRALAPAMRRVLASAAAGLRARRQCVARHLRTPEVGQSRRHPDQGVPRHRGGIGAAKCGRCRCRDVPIIVLGAGGHARVLLDALQLIGGKVLGVIDPALKPGEPGPARIRRARW